MCVEQVRGRCRVLVFQEAWEHRSLWPDVVHLHGMTIELGLRVYGSRTHVVNQIPRYSVRHEAIVALVPPDADHSKQRMG